MDKNIQILVISIVGSVAILTLFTGHVDLSQVCIAGLIGFLSAKSTETHENQVNNSEEI